VTAVVAWPARIGRLLAAVFLVVAVWRDDVVAAIVGAAFLLDFGAEVRAAACVDRSREGRS